MGALSGAGSGAAIGTALAPGIGTAIGAGLGLIGGFFSHKAKNKAQDQANRQQEAEFQRQQAIEDQRARARASLLMGMLKGYGKAGDMNEEQLFQSLRKNIAKGNPINTGGRNMGFIGNGLSGIGQMLLLGMRGQNPGAGAGAGLSNDPSLMGAAAPGSGIFEPGMMPPV